MLTDASRSRYPDSVYDELVSVEDRHFWFRARNRLIARVVGDLARKLPDGFLGLEVGTGTGYVLRILEEVCRRGKLIGMERSLEGLSHARKRTKAPLIQGDVFRLPFLGPFHLVGLFDVLEHLDDDHLVLSRLREVMAPGGFLVMTVPAYMTLWSDFDDYSGHFRRYSPEHLRGVLVKAGFRVDFLSPFMTTLAPLMWAARRGSRSQLSTDAQRERVSRQLHPSWLVNGVMLRLLECEIPLLARGIRLPFGSSLLAIARTDAGPD